MNILIRSLRLYILGIYITLCKKYFDNKMDKYIEHNRSLSDRRLTALSNKCSSLYKKFTEEESSLLFEIALKKSGYTD
ncbi:MAG: hypothetical protein UH081_08835 [Clostridia bacterium]|nr:hypothetical protein [Clostridia bacterium]